VKGGGGSKENISNSRKEENYTATITAKPAYAPSISKELHA